MINSMRGCVACDDPWPWPISSRSFGLDLENRVRSVASTVLDGLFLYLAQMITIVRGCVACYVFFRIGKFEFLANFWNFSALTLKKKIYSSGRILVIFSTNAILAPVDGVRSTLRNFRLGGLAERTKATPVLRTYDGDTKYQLVNFRWYPAVSSNNPCRLCYVTRTLNEMGQICVHTAVRKCTWISTIFCG